MNNDIIKKKFYTLYEICLAIYIIGFVMYVRDYYYDILSAKFYFFAIGSIILFLFFIVKNICLIFNRDRIVINKLRIIDCFLIAFILINFLSWINSPWRNELFIAKDYSYLGLVFYICIFLIYISITNLLKTSNIIKIIFPVTLIIESVIGIIQSLGYDFLGFFKDVLFSELQVYIGTLGNINVYGEFICTFFAISFYLFCFNEDIRYTVLYMIAVISGYFGMFCSNSDGCVLGVALCMIVMLYFAFKKSSYLRKYSFALLGFALVSSIWKLLKYIFKGYMWVQSPTNKILMGTGFIIVIAAFAVLLFAISVYMENKTLKISTYYLILVVSICVLIGFSILYFSTLGRNMQIGKLSSYLKFDDNWGSDRGYAWIRAAQIFKEAPIKNKIIGYGPSTTQILYCNYCYDEMIQKFDAFFSTPHNDLLYYLLTNGAVGVVLYISIVAVSIKNAMACAKKNHLYGAVAAGILVYFLCGMVNITQNITAPYIYILISIANTDVIYNKIN